MRIAANSSVLTYSSFIIKNLKNLCLTDFYFHRTVCKQKYFEIDGESIFWTCRQNGSQTGKNFDYNEVTAVVLISEGCLLSFLGE